MKRSELILARLFLVSMSVLAGLVLIEALANHYLWNIASKEEFNLLASINQIKQRYGDDFFIRSDGVNGSKFTTHPYLGYRLTPNLKSGNNRHNSLGFRGEEFTIAKPQDTYRIVAVGGSTTYSNGVNDFRGSYPAQLETYLAEAGYDQVEVINAGVGGYSSYHSLINIEFRVLPLEPDLIIIYQGYNDIHTRFVYPFSSYLGDNSGHVAPFVSDTVMPPIWEYSTALRILGVRAGLSKSHIAVDWHRDGPAQTSVGKAFRGQWRTGTYPSGFFADVSAMDILKNNPPIHFERNLNSMIAVAKQQDVDVLLLTFATSTEFNSVYVASEEYMFALAQHNDVTRDTASATETRLFDLAAVFPEDPSLFTDGRHMTLDGNRVRAQLIGDFIISEFLT